MTAFERRGGLQAVVDETDFLISQGLLFHSWFESFLKLTGDSIDFLILPNPEKTSSVFWKWHHEEDSKALGWTEHSVWRINRADIVSAGILLEAHNLNEVSEIKPYTGVHVAPVFSDPVIPGQELAAGIIGNTTEGSESRPETNRILSAEYAYLMRFIAQVGDVTLYANFFFSDREIRK